MFGFNPKPVCYIDYRPFTDRNLIIERRLRGNILIMVHDRFIRLKLKWASNRDSVYSFSIEVIETQSHGVYIRSKKMTPVSKLQEMLLIKNMCEVEEKIIDKMEDLYKIGSLHSYYDETETVIASEEYVTEHLWKHGMKFEILRDLYSFLEGIWPCADKESNNRMNAIFYELVGFERGGPSKFLAKHFPNIKEELEERAQKKRIYLNTPYIIEYNGATELVIIRKKGYEDITIFAHPRMYEYKHFYNTIPWRNVLKGRVATKEEYKKFRAEVNEAVAQLLTSEDKRERERGKEYVEFFEKFDRKVKRRKETVDKRKTRREMLYNLLSEES